MSWRQSLQLMSLGVNELLKSKPLRHNMIAFIYLFLLFWILKSILFDIGMAASPFWNPFDIKFYLIPFIFSIYVIRSFIFICLHHSMYFNYIIWSICIQGNYWYLRSYYHYYLKLFSNHIVVYFSLSQSLPLWLSGLFQSCVWSLTYIWVSHNRYLHCDIKIIYFLNVSILEWL